MEVSENRTLIFTRLRKNNLINKDFFKTLELNAWASVLGSLRPDALSDLDLTLIGTNIVLVTVKNQLSHIGLILDALVILLAISSLLHFLLFCVFSFCLHDFYVCRYKKEETKPPQSSSSSHTTNVIPGLQPQQKKTVEKGEYEISC